MRGYKGETRSFINLHSMFPQSYIINHISSNFVTTRRFLDINLKDRTQFSTISLKHILLPLPNIFIYVQNDHVPRMFPIKDLYPYPT
jgi:hypothetical protein